MYYSRTSYHDDTPADIEHHDTQTEAAEAYQHATEQRDQLGQAFGDVYRISWGRIKDGKMQAINATTYS
jgi:hypothetical protein